MGGGGVIVVSVLFLGLYLEGEKISLTENNLLGIRDEVEDAAADNDGLRSVSALRAINLLLYSNKWLGLNMSAEAGGLVVDVVEVTQEKLSSSSSNETFDMREEDDVDEDDEEERSVRCSLFSLSLASFSLASPTESTDSCLTQGVLVPGDTDIFSIISLFASF